MENQDFDITSVVKLHLTESSDDVNSLLNDADGNCKILDRPRAQNNWNWVVGLNQVGTEAVNRKRGEPQGF